LRITQFAKGVSSMSINWRTPRYVESNGIRMAVYEQGAGVPVVMSHGFPELAYSWRHQLPSVADAGFHAIAPDQRGYGLTDRPEAIESYDIHHLTGDLVGMLDALKIEKAVFVGHDWGGIVTWAMPLLHPHRVLGVVGVNTPFLPRAPMDPIALMRAAYGENMYIVFFQKPGVADALLAADVGKTLRFFYRKSAMTIEEFDKRPPEERNLALAAALQTDERTWPGEPLLTEEEFEFYFTAFSRTGFTGGINWYRNFTRNWQTTEGIAQKVDVPCLMVMAENDIVLRPSLADGMKAFVPDLEKHLIKDCGHWTQAEKPTELNQVLTGWLKRRFG
jgi:pimeloyl-ACP methyl ester carboxylesterase